MCKGEGCPKKNLCFRYTAEASPFRQSYFASTPVYEDENGELKCDFYYSEYSSIKSQFELTEKNKNKNDNTRLTRS